MSLEHSFSSAFERFDNQFDSAFDGEGTGGGLRGQLDNLRPLGGVDGRFEQAFDRMDTKFEEMDAKFNGISHSLGGTLDGFADSLFPSADVPHCTCTDGRFDFKSSSLCHLEFFDDAGHLCDAFDGTSCHKILPNNCACCVMHGSDSPPRYIVIDARGDKASAGSESNENKDVAELQRMREELAKLKASVGPQQTPQAPTQTPSKFAEFLPLMTQLVTTIISAVGRFIKKDPEDPSNPPKNPEDATTVTELTEKIEKLEADKKAKDSEIKKLRDSIEELRKSGGTGGELEELEKRFAKAKKEQRRLEKELQKLKNSSSSTSSPFGSSAPTTTAPASTTSTPTSAPPPITTRPLNAAEKREEIAEKIQRDLVTKLATVGITVTQRDEVLDAEFNGAKIIDGFTLKEALSVDDNKDAFVDELNKTVKDHLQTVVTDPNVTVTVVDVLAPEAECTLSVFGETRSVKTEPKKLLEVATIDRLQKEAQKEFVKEIVGGDTTGVNGVEVGTLTDTQLTPTSLRVTAASSIELTAIRSKADLETELIAFRDNEVVKPMFENIDTIEPFASRPPDRQPSFVSITDGTLLFDYPTSRTSLKSIRVPVTQFGSRPLLEKQVLRDFILKISEVTSRSTPESFPSPHSKFSFTRTGRELRIDVPTSTPYAREVNGSFSLELEGNGIRSAIPEPELNSDGTVKSVPIKVTIPDNLVSETGEIKIHLTVVKDVSKPITSSDFKEARSLNELIIR